MIFLSCATNHEAISASTSSTVSEAEPKKASLFEKLQENNHLPIEERIAFYYELKKNHSNEYDFENDRGLNQYGYSLLMYDKVKEAIEIFKLLVSEFPNNANAYDSLGEGYMKDGNEELSLLNYEKSVELNPENNYAIDQITKMKGLEILDTDWGKEFFHFPIHFAPDLPYEGLEEVVFPKNWRKPDSTDFWSYVFVWEIDNKESVTAEELERDLSIYFDGLMEVVKDEEDGEIIKTRIDFQRNTDPNDTVYIIGDLTIFDAFATHAPLDLNARIFSNYCEKREKLFLLFQFSPQDYDQPIWDKLRTVLVRETVCEK
jgi:tetratricopeptide (TPR) repeat protein